MEKYSKKYLEVKKAKYRKYQREYKRKIRKSKKSIQQNTIDKPNTNEIDNK